MASIQITLGLLTDDISLDTLQIILTEAHERITREGLYKARLAISTERGYYNDVEVTVALIAYRAETPEEIELKKQTNERNARMRKEQLIRELKRLDDQYEL